MRRLRNIVRWLLASALCAYLLLLVGVNARPCQTYLGGVAGGALSDLLGTEVRVERVVIGLFNRVELDGVEVFDRESAEMLKAGEVSCKVDLSSLLSGRDGTLVIRTVSLLDAELRGYRRHADSPANFQFVIDALSGKEEGGGKPFADLRINSVILRRVNVSYDQLDAPRTPGVINARHLALGGVDGNVTLKRIGEESLRFRVRSLTMRESSGLRVDRLCFDFDMESRGDRGRTLELSNFELRLPHSSVVLPKLTADFGNVHSLQPAFAAAERVAVTLSSEDLCHLTPLPRGLRFDIALSTRAVYDKRADGTHTLKLSALEVKEARHGLAAAFDEVGTEFDGKGLCGGWLDMPRLTAPRGALYALLSPLLANKDYARWADNLGAVTACAKGSAKMRGRAGAASVALETEAGRLYAEVKGQDGKYTYTLNTNELSPSVVLSRPELPSMLTLSVSGSAETDGKSLKGVTAAGSLRQMMYRGYRYHDVDFSASSLSGLARCEVHSTDDPNLSFSLRGGLRLAGGKPSSANVLAEVHNIAPAALGFSTPYGNARMQGRVEANFTSLSPSAPQGRIALNNIRMAGGKRGDYALESFTATLSGVGSEGRLVVKSDFLDAELHGPLSPQRLVTGLQGVAWRCLPGLWKKPSVRVDDNWGFAARVKRTDELRVLLGVDASMEGTAVAQGVVDAGGGVSSVTVHTPAFSVSGQEFGESSVYLHGSGSRYECLARTERRFAGSPYKVELSLSAADSVLRSVAAWDESGASSTGGRVAKVGGGKLSASTRFFANTTGTVDFLTRIHPTQIMLGDSVWQVSSGEVSKHGRNISFSDVRVAHADQSLSVEGSVSPSRRDSIVARLNRVDISYVLGMIDFDAVSFGGAATGDAVFSTASGTPRMHARLRVPDFTFNGGPMGDSHIRGSWDAAEGSIHLDADMRLDSLGNGTEVTGFVSPKNKNLCLDITAKDTRLLFLRRYMDGIFSGFDGYARGNVRLYGPFKALDFEGEVEARAQAGIPVTGVDYRIGGGRVYFRPGAFVFSGFDVTDKRGGRGNASGALRHTHLKDLTYDFDLTASRLLCYDRGQSPDMPFYSTAVGTGSVRLQGRPGYFQADMELTPENGSTLVYDMGNTSIASDNSFVRFGEKKRTAATDSEGTEQSGESTGTPAAPLAESGGTDIVLNFTVNANPALLVKVVTDARAGDYLAVNGSGAMRASFHNKGSFDMYGKYTVERGEYRLSLKDVIRKRLTLRPGGSVTFSGRPMQGALDLAAVYTLSGVPLSDLNYGAGFGQKTVKADCILNIGGRAAAPQITFDLDLHNISEDEKQMVRQLIATDEDMSRQVIYLLGIGRFYTANTSGGQTYTAQQQSGAAMRSLLSSTLTGQLNSAIASALGGNSRWSFGANVSPGTLGWSDMEVDGLLQGRLFNDRLLINGNFGYRDTPMYNSNFVGDFDIQYLLTPKGSVSLKAYSETTDRYFTKSALTTQGVGIALKRDFSNLRDLFSPQYLPRKRK